MNIEEMFLRIDVEVRIPSALLSDRDFLEMPKSHLLDYIRTQENSLQNIRGVLTNYQQERDEG